MAEADLHVEHSFRSPFSLGDMQLGLCSHYVALPFVRTSIGIWQLANLTSKPVELEGHTARVSCLRFGSNNNRTVLVSAGSDYILTWNIEDCITASKQGTMPRGRILAPVIDGSSKRPPSTSWICLDAECSRVAACIGWEVRVWDAQSKDLLVTLEGHDGRVTCAEFLPYYQSTLVTASEDRTFKIWDIERHELIFKSTILSAWPLTCIAVNAWDRELALGSVDGMVYWVTIPESGHGFKCTQTLDVGRALGHHAQLRAEASAAASTEFSGKVLSSRPSWQTFTNPSKLQELSATNSDCKVTETVLAMHFLSLIKEEAPSQVALSLSASDKTAADIDRLLRSRLLLGIVTTTSIIHMDARSMDVVSCTELRVDMTVRSEDDFAVNASASSAMLGCCCFADADVPARTLFVVGSLFDNSAHLCHVGIPLGGWSSSVAVKDLELHVSNLSLTDVSLPDVAISILSDCPLLPTSPLNVRLMPKQQAVESKKNSKPAASTSTLSSSSCLLPPLNQPVTVHSKVKSSGYSQPKQQHHFFKPVTGTWRSAPPPAAPVVKGHDLHARSTSWNLDGQHPSGDVKATAKAGDGSVCINMIKFSPDGRQLLCALANKLAISFKLPLSEEAVAFTGHNGSVNSASWSRQGQYILTASTDATARMWTKGQADTLMEFRHVRNNFKTDVPTSENNGVFDAEIKHAQFYYMDQFVLLASGNTLRLYACHLDPTKNDIKRYRDNSKYKMAASLTMVKAQNISAVAAVNDFYSYIVLCAGSDRSLDIFDLNVSRQVRSISDVHSRPAHAICLNEGSSHASLPTAAYNLFLTAAVTDGMKLWDLRASRCVTRYEGHRSRAVACGIAWSPCGRYIATGSEDKTAYVLDLASGNVVTKLRGHTEAVSSVAFHPHCCEVATGSIDGIVKVYT